MGLRRPVRVVGVGSPQGDDALGWEVIRRLREAEMKSAGVELHIAEGGQGLLDWLDGRGSLVIVDAIGGDRPGTIHRIEWPDPRLETLWSGSTHGLRPSETLELAGVLGVLPPRVVIFGIEAAAWEPGSGMSDAVAEAVPILVERIRKELIDA